MESIDDYMRLIKKDGKYLWPKTPVGNLQAEIWKRVGASDWNITDKRCRTRNILNTMISLIDNEVLRPDPIVFDLCCGDGVVLCFISRLFFLSRCYGIDLLSYPSHEIAKRCGVTFYKTPIQDLVETNPPEIIDVCIMLNTFRGWEKAELGSECHDLPQKTLKWMKTNCRFLFLTVTESQITWLKNSGLFVFEVGPGEDDSRLICAFPCEGVGGPTGVWR
jgi:hypothetical protein